MKKANEPAHSLKHTPHYWYVPYQRNPFFTGREEILHFIREMRQQEKAGVWAQSYALSGPGGIGKTQIVLEYLYRSASTYDAIFWIGANTRGNILTDFSAIADMLHLPEKDDQDHNQVVNAVKRWFHTHERWLLIFDDINNPEFVKEFFPAARNSTILLTTQRATLGMIAWNIELEPLSQVEATQLLLRRAQLLAPDATPEAMFLENASRPLCSHSFQTYCNLIRYSNNAPFYERFSGTFLMIIDDYSMPGLSM